MLTAINSNLQKILAFDVDKKQGQFICPDCGQGVTLKKGKVVAPHFAHGKASTCARKGETVAHMTAKLELFKLLKTQQDVVSVEIEPRYLKNKIPDILVKHKNGTYTAWEGQQTNLTLEEVRHRTNTYPKYFNGRRLRVQWFTIWAALPKKRYRSEAGKAEFEHRLKIMEMYFAKCYDGVLPIWVHDARYRGLYRAQLSKVVRNDAYWGTTVLKQTKRFALENKFTKEVLLYCDVLDQAAKEYD